MGIGWPDQEMHGQAGTTTEQRMHAIAPQERTRMVSGRVSHSSIGIGSTPSQERGAIDDEIAGSDQAAAHGSANREHKERLKEWSSCRLPAFAELGRTGNAWLAIVPERQATGQGQRGPVREPVMHVLLGQPPQGFEEGDHEPRLLAVGAWSTAWAFGQGRWTAPMCQLNSQAAQRQQV